MSVIEEFVEDNARLSLLLRDTAIGVDDVIFLEFVRQAPNATQAEIASKAKLSRSSASRAMIRLLNLELLSERLSHDDMRASRLKITARGENVLIEASYALGAKTIEAFAARAASFNDACQQSGIDHSCALIVLLLGRNVTVHSSAIAKKTGLKTSTLSSAIRRLKSKGLVRTASDLADKRMLTVGLTPSGASLTARIASAVESAKSDS